MRRLSRVRDLMHAEPSEALTLPELARLAGMSHFHFLRSFKHAFGATPHAYLVDVRLDRAKTLLAQDQSVTDVCMDVGFSSLGSFSALFARRFGATPSSWRKRHWQVRWVGSQRLFIPWCYLQRFS